MQKNGWINDGTAITGILDAIKKQSEADFYKLIWNNFQCTPKFNIIK